MGLEGYLTDSIEYDIDTQEDEKHLSENDFFISHWNFHNPLPIHLHLRSDDYRSQNLVRP